MSNQESGAQFATKSHQTTIDLQAGIIASQKNEIDRLNVLAVENAAEIASLKETVKWYQGEAGKRMGEAARAEIATAPVRRAGGLLFDDRTVYAAMSVEGHARTSSENVRDVLDAVTRVAHSAAPAAPSEQAEPQKAATDCTPAPWEVWNGNHVISKTEGQVCVCETNEDAALIVRLRNAAAPAAPLPGQPEQWKGLNDVQWMNIVNHDQAFDLYDKNDAVHAAVKMTEAKLKEINASDGAAPLPAQPVMPTPRDMAIAQAVRQACVNAYSPDISAHDWSEAMGDIDLAGVIRRVPQLPSQPEPQSELLAYFLRSAYPVDTTIDARGYRWSEAYLDQARAAALAGAAPLPELTGPSEALTALLARIDDAHESYERFGGICKFEGSPMISAATLKEIVALRGEYHVAALAAFPSPAPAPTDTKGGLDIDDVIAELGIGDEVAAIRSERLDAPARTREPQDGLVAAPVSQHETIAGAVARGWCSPENESKVMDTDLALAITREVETMLASRCRAQGGDTKTSDTESSRMGGITSKESAETAAPGASTERRPMQILSDLEVMRLRDVGATWMSEDGRDALDDWLLGAQSPPVGGASTEDAQ